ncbi:class I adenylate-forming enzyme family protein [Comamonas sp. C11]|uniref:class I adenylate-forming enzyme family protein n=1 Tax=Comamonas sp. C11 TaxID=2966554 RepID=UPI0021121448|nr:class I adenylate-forming enzyme family protein [Comamonas sp. C11]UUC91490.1 acyl--CoA ligase [Comamonas sp. C11]
MDHWMDKHVPAVRDEVLFGSRRVRCFVERPGSLQAMWQNAVKRFPHREALVYGDERLSYVQADDQVRSIASGLAAHGIVKGDRVALLVGNNPVFVLTLFALQQLGAIAVPISTREQRAGVTYMLGQSGAKGVVFDAEFADRLPLEQDLPGLTLRVVHGDFAGAVSLGELTAQGQDDCAPAIVAAEDVAIILYTSGTTGHPKGAMLTHVNIAHSVRHFELVMQLSSVDRIALAVPATHVTGLVAMVLTAIHVGGACVIAPPFKAADFLTFMAREAITYTIMVPAMYSLLLLSPELDRSKLDQWRLGGYGGAPMAVGTIEELAHRLPRLGLVNAYGATETTSPTSVSPIASDVAHADSVGVPLPCAHVRVVDDNGQDLPQGETGELWIGGPMVVPGYWDNPEGTAASFTDGYWHSGDIGFIDTDGFVHVNDRMKDMLSRGGFKIYSAEVESRLMSYPGMVEAAVVGKPCPVLGERVHAFVHAPGVSRDDEALRRHCAETLSDYKVPESYTWSDEPLPRNANGKLIKRTLRERLIA